MKLSTVAEVVDDFKAGKCVIVVDDEDRENEGDIVCAGEFATPENINFMITEGRGLVCTPISSSISQKLKLPDMTAENTELHGVRFTVSIDLKAGTTTGISARERSMTIKALTDEQTKPEDFARPGHIFPLIAHDKGLLGRNGHTEATIYLTELAGLKPVAVLCEILKKDGEMARRPELEIFAQEHKLKIISVERLIEHLNAG